MKASRIGAVAVVTLALAACNNQGTGQKETGGALIGAGLGALAGSQIGGGVGKFAAIAVGTLAGAFIGSEVGKSLDRADRLAMQRSTQSALEANPTGQTATWRNPDNGHQGTVTPTRTYQTASGEYCREYQQTVTIGGKTEQAYGKACRQPDGTWKVAS